MSISGRAIHLIDAGNNQGVIHLNVGRDGYVIINAWTDFQVVDITRKCEGIAPYGFYPTSIVFQEAATGEWAICQSEIIIEEYITGRFTDIKIWGITWSWNALVGVTHETYNCIIATAWTPCVVDDYITFYLDLMPITGRAIH